MLRRNGAFMAAGGLATTTTLLGKMQADQDMPISSSRKPMVYGGKVHEHPGARDVQPQEAKAWRFMQRWELEMKGEWDDLEQFKGLPKPKKQFGNEAAAIVWPYAVLLENVIKIHPFTKSIYCYYGQHSSTDEGLKANQLATRFARECMVPITFHNPQTHVETEMLLEYNDTPWLVIHSLDSNTPKKLLPIKFPTQEQISAAPQQDPKFVLLAQVVEACNEIGNSVADKETLMRTFHDRPNQCNYLRVNYQWMGKTPEERQQHLVRWSNEEMSGDVNGGKGNPVMDRKLYRRHSVMNDWLQAESDKPVAWSMVGWRARKENGGLRSKTGEAQGLQGFTKEVRHSTGLFTSSAAPVGSGSH